VGAGAQGEAVALVGFMGAGKSAVGRELAAALSLTLVDTDDLIAVEAGPIDDIFRECGESGFRRLEAQVVTGALDAALERPCVLALGGGAVLSAAVREALARLPHVVWLTAPLDVLWARAGMPGEPRRPLAVDEAAFRRLLATREPLYRQVATLIVDTAGGTPAAAAAGIADAVRRESAVGPRVEGGLR
jgi:shikimate kinase